MSGAIEIRWATRDDLEAIARIQAGSLEAPAWKPSSYLDYDCRVACVAEGDPAPGADDRVAGSAPTGDPVAGFIVSRQVAAYPIESHEIESHGTESHEAASCETGNTEREILSLAVDPARRRQGIGRALVEHELASSSKGTTWFLEVRESNVAAISLYRAMGFTTAGRRPDYYRDPAEAAIVMRFFS